MLQLVRDRATPPSLMSLGPTPLPVSEIDECEVGERHLSSTHATTCLVSNRYISPLLVTVGLGHNLQPLVSFAVLSC